MRINKLAGALAIAGLATVSGAAFATNGYFSHGYGIKAKSIGGAGIALPQDSLAAATNPAGMVMVGDRIDFGLDVFMPNRSSTWNGDTGTGASAGTAINGAFIAVTNGREYESGSGMFFVPEFGYNKMISNDMSLGVSVYGNGGMNTDYGAIVIAGNTAATNTYTNLEQLFIAPTFSMKIAPKHSIGVSLNLAYQTFEARGVQAFATAAQSASPGDVTDRGVDTSTGMGMKVGWIGELSPGVTMGATYQTRTYMSKFNKYKGMLAEQGDFDVPETYGVGIAFKANDKLTIAGDVVQINYGSIRSIANPGVQFPSVSGNLMGNDNGAGFGWDDQTVFKIGMTYQYNENLQLRAGFNHAKMPISQQNTFFNILAPATVEDHLTLGATWILANKAELTVSYMHAFSKTLKGVSNGNGGCYAGNACGGAATSVNGFPVDLKMDQNSLGIAYGWKM